MSVTKSLVGLDFRLSFQSALELPVMAPVLRPVKTLFLATLVLCCQVVYASDVEPTSGDFSVFLSEPGARFTESHKTFNLDDGTVLLQTRQPVEIHLGPCKLAVHSGVALLLHTKAGLGCVTNLCESAEQSATLIYGDCSLKLRAGRQAWFGPTEAVVASAIKEEPGRPLLIRQHQSPGVGIIAEFAVYPATLLDTTSSVVEEMKESKQAKVRKLYDRIIKTSAALTMAH